MTTTVSLVKEELKSKPSKNQHLPKPFEVAELNDLVQGLGLSKYNVEVLEPKENKGLPEGCTFAWHRHRDKFSQVFQKTGSLVYCIDAEGLIRLMGLTYNPTEWRLFLDSSCRSLRAVSCYSMGQALQQYLLDIRSKGLKLMKICMFCWISVVHKALMVYMWWPEDCGTTVRNAKRVYKVPMLFMPVR